MKYKIVPNTPLSENEPDPTDFVFLDEEPEPLNLEDVKAMIGYPKEAKEQGITGTVIARILVNEKGDSSRYILVKKVHKSLYEAVEEHVFKLKFSPALKDKKPILFWTNIQFRFR